MKRAERHHLKDNELANLAAGARRMVAEQQVPILVVAAAVVLVLGAAGGYYAWTNRVQGRAHSLLADALVLEDARIGPPPAPGSPAPAGPSFATAREKFQAELTKFKIVADEYPSSDAGLFARYREAATFMALGEPASAAKSYQEVIDRAGTSLYAQMARLGLAEAQAQTGQVDQAIATFKALSEVKDGLVPVDGVLMRLGRTYRDAGKTADAVQTFNRLVEEFPDSTFASDARRELDQMKQS